ncbi:MAG TPA: thioredoxin family protein [Chitinophagales bacterium]|nr:thioredoxin family protein [Chitinophagales bacterium]
MKRIIAVAAAFLLLASFAPEQGYKVGDMATDFNLKNVDGKMVSLGNYKDAKGFIVVFTCNHCPFAKAYESRIIALDKKFAAKGYPVIAINPNDPNEVPEDSYANMQARAKEKNYPFPYLMDESQQIAKAYGATRTPHVFVLQKVKGDYMVKYIGAIDDNSDDASAVKEKYVENAVNALLAGKKVSPDFTKAIGCTIKWKKA